MPALFKRLPHVNTWSTDCVSKWMPGHLIKEIWYTVHTYIHTSQILSQPDLPGRESLVIRYTATCTFVWGLRHVNTFHMRWNQPVSSVVLHCSAKVTAQNLFNYFPFEADTPMQHGHMLKFCNLIGHTPYEVNSMCSSFPDSLSLVRVWLHVTT